MKSVLIIGLGNFGHYLCRDLASMNNQIMIVDKDEGALEDLLDVSTSSLIADCTRESTLKRLGVPDFDICFVCIGGDFQANLQITSLLKDLGASYVVSKANNEVHAKFLLRNGADDVIHPNKDSAMRAAVKYNANHVFDYIDLKDGYSICEIAPLHKWVGRSIVSSDIRALYHVYILAILNPTEGNTFMPSPQTVIREDDHLMVLAHENTINRLLSAL